MDIEGTELTLRQKESLLAYASGIVGKKDPVQIRKVALELASHLWIHYISKEEEKAYFVAMEQQFRNRGGGVEPYLGGSREFLEAADILYKVLAPWG